jgi:aryl-alcohol dehydrogenase-like predicted oxidoreductase
MCQELGIGTCTWSPLAGGFFSGKYTKEKLGEGRLKIAKDSGNPVLQRILMKDANWKILDELIEISKKIDRPPVQVALSWIAKRPGISSTIIGATKLEQLKANLAAIDLEIPAELSKKLDEISAPELVTPYMFYQPGMRAMVTGGVSVNREPEWFR